MEFQKIWMQFPEMAGIDLRKVELLSGGDICKAAKLETGNGAFFVKWNKDEGLLRTEQKNLDKLRETGIFRIPECYGCIAFEGNTYLLLEYIRSRSPIECNWQKFGEQLRALHQVSQDRYGLEYNNYIGTLPQDNSLCTDWTDFYIEQRLGFQLKIAGNMLNTSIHRSFEALFMKLADLLPEGKPELIHGDLWSGNFIVDDAGEIVLIDPAAYYGRGEADLAMSSLFGGFDMDFYRAYAGCQAADKDMERRLDIYKLYPLLAHLNMFGTSYTSPIVSILNSFK